MEESSTSEMPSELTTPLSTNPPQEVLSPLKKQTQIYNGGKGKMRDPRTNLTLNKLDRAPRVEKRSKRSVLDILRKWKPGREMAGERLELETVWEWLEAKAKTEEKSLTEMPVNPAGVRLTLVYGTWILDEKEEFTAKDLRHAAMASLDDYLKWDISEMCQFVKHQHDIKIRDNLRSHFSVVEKKLLEQIKGGSSSAMANWLRATGNYQGEKEDSSGYRLIKIPSSFEETPLPEESGEYQVANHPVSSPST